MDELVNYHIEIQGQIAENELNASSPLHLTVLEMEGNSTLVTLHTDQSGLIGLLRHLHTRGYELNFISLEKNLL